MVRELSLFNFDITHLYKVIFLGGAFFEIGWQLCSHLLFFRPTVIISYALIFFFLP